MVFSSKKTCTDSYTIDKRFLFHVITGRHLYYYPEVLINRHALVFFEASDLKEVRSLFFICRMTVQC